MSVRDCPCCEGRGCSECDDTGRRYGELHDVGDGMTLHISGTGDAGASPGLVEALTALSKAAFARMGQASERSANTPVSAPLGDEQRSDRP